MRLITAPRLLSVQALCWPPCGWQYEPTFRILEPLAGGALGC